MHSDKYRKQVTSSSRLVHVWWITRWMHHPPTAYYSKWGIFGVDQWQVVSPPSLKASHSIIYHGRYNRSLYNQHFVHWECGKENGAQTLGSRLRCQSGFLYSNTMKWSHTTSLVLPKEPNNFQRRFIPLHQLNAFLSLCKSLHHGFDPSILNHFIVWYVCVHGSDMRHHRLMVKADGWGEK